MKKKVFPVIAVILILALAYFWVSSGFIKNTSVFINDYTVSSDGKKITINVGVSSSMGFIREVKVHQQQGGKLYLDCYSAFGGLNGRIGAKDTFTFLLDEDTTAIAVYRNPDCYETVLVKNADGLWQRADQQ